MLIASQKSNAPLPSHASHPCVGRHAEDYHVPNQCDAFCCCGQPLLLDGAFPTLDDAAGLPPTVASASPSSQLAAVPSPAGTHRRDRPNPWSTFISNTPTHNPWVVVNAFPTAWLSTPIASCAHLGCPSCARPHSVSISSSANSSS